MTGRKLLRSLMACGVSLSVVTQGATTEACWLFQKKTTVAYAPVAVAAPVPQVCSYQPQTCYRTVYVNTPVTTYQPVAGTDPCTGCPTTCMRPVTTYVSQARMVPYTTYRPVFAPVAACNTCNYSPVVAAPACATGGCGQTVGYAPAVSYQPAMPWSRPAATYTPAPAGGLNIAPTTGAPTLSSTMTYQPAPYQPAAAAASSYQSSPVVQSAPRVAPQTTFGTLGSSVPSLNGTVVGAPTIIRVQPETSQPAPASRLAPVNPTFKDGNGNQSDTNKQDDSHLKPIPDTASENRKTGTAIPHTEIPDRTTAYPTQRAWAFTPVAKSETVRGESDKSENLDDSGWRAARR